MKALFLVVLTFSSLTLTFAQAEYGVAIPYSDKFHGSKTASGEKYDRNKLTASHRTLPLGTKVRITNVKNQKTAVAHINDTGPFIKGCITNISQKVATTLGLLGSGGKVRIEVINKAKPAPKVVEKPKAVPKKPTVNTPAPVIEKRPIAKPEKKEVLYKIQLHEIPQKQYGVQIGLYSNYENLLQKVADIQANYFKNILIFTRKKENGSSTYRLIIGPFEEEKTAESYRVNAGKKGIKGFVVNLGKL